MKQGATDHLSEVQPSFLNSAIQQAQEQSRPRKERIANAETLRLWEIALNAVSQGVLISDENRRIIYANTTFFKLSGYDESDVLGRSCSIMQGPDSDQETIQKIRAALTAGEAFEGKILNYRKNGEPFWNELSIAPLRGDENEPLRFIGIQRDITGHKQAEEALRQSEERFSGAFEQAPIGITLVSPEGRFLKVNRALCRVVGYSEEELLTRTFQEISHPEDLAAEVENVRRLLAGEIPSYQIEKRYIHADGQVVPVLLNVSLMRDGQGRPLYFIAQIQDIAERKRIETRLRLLVDSNAQGVFFWNTKGGITVANDAFLRITGYTREDFEAGRINWQAMTPPEYEHLDRRALDEIAASGISSFYEKVWIRKDGSRVPILLGAASFADNPEEGVCFVIDITERNAVKEAKLLNQERLLLATKVAQVGIWDYDFPSDTMVWDEQMFALYGLDPETALPGYARWKSSLHPDDRASAEAELEEARLPEGKPFDTEYRIIRPDDGSVRVIRALATLVRNGTGEPLRMVGTNCDITRERKREQDLREALAQQKELTRSAEAGERAKSEFLAVMSHEVRTPLNGILGFAELLLQTPNLPPEARNYAGIITSSGHSLLRILNDVLDCSRLDAGRLPIEKNPFAPRETLGDVRALLSQQAGDKGLDLRLSLDESIPENLEGDAGRLRQILLNLAGNAIKFTERGSVTIGLRPGDGLEQREFFVNDTGPGITPEQIGRIFQPFTQADSTISRRHGGTGLGLSISRRLAELMGGTLTVQSQPGYGSEFILSVPLHEPARSPDVADGFPAQTLDQSFAHQHPGRILVVEDDRVNLKLILALLRKLGYEALAASNGREAVELHQSEHPDCILMDLQMPEMDGIEATKKIRAGERITRPNHPVFIFALTANIVPADRQRCFDAGMNSYLNKPVKMAALAAVMAEAADHAARP